MHELSVEQVATLVEVANLYYKENLSQQEIADRLGVSRSLIALYLKEAREHEIVRIEVINPRDSCSSLALDLRRGANLEQVVVVPHGHMSQELTRRAVAAAAAHHLDSQLRDGDVLGLAWGRTTNRVVELLAPTQPRDIEVIPLLGESSYTGSYTQINQIVLQTAQHYNGRPSFLLAPMLVGSQKLRDMLFEDNVVRDVAERWERLTIACFGVGLVPPAPGMIVYVGDEHIPMLEALHAVGDVCAHYFDSQGEMIRSDISDRMINVSVEQLRRARCRIAVATGVEKAPAIVGAIRAGFPTSLVLDAQLAQAVIQIL